MRNTFVYTLLGLAVSSVAAAGHVYPGGKLLPGIMPAQPKRLAHRGSSNSNMARDIEGGFIPVTPASKAIPVVPGTNGNKKRRIRREDVVVPETLHAKRAPSCGDASYGVCPNQQMCCPIGGLCCRSGDCCDQGKRCCAAGGCCPTTHNCVSVGGVAGCCPIGQLCNANSNYCADPGYVHCANENFCCKPGDTCAKGANGKASCHSSDEFESVTSTPTTSLARSVERKTTSTTQPASQEDVEKTSSTTTSRTTSSEEQEVKTTQTQTQNIPTTASAVATNPLVASGGPTTMYNPTAVTTLPRASSSVAPANNTDVPIGSLSGAMGVAAGLSYTFLLTVVSLAIGHVLVLV